MVLTQKRNLCWLEAIAKPMDKLKISNMFRNDLTDPLSGAEHGREYWPFAKLKCNPIWVVDAEETADLGNLNDIIDRLKGRAAQFYFSDPISRFHRDVFIGQGDGSRVAFPVPFKTDSGSMAFRGAAAGGTLSPTTYEAANLLSDDESAMISGLGSLAAVASVGAAVLSRDSDLSYFGKYAAKVTPTGSATNYGVETSEEAVTAGETYTGLGWVDTASTLDFLAEIQWYDAGHLPLAPSVGTGVAGGGAAWVPLSVIAVAPVGAVTAKLILRSSGADTDPAWFDCLGLSPLHDPLWWLPSISPRVAVFGTAPANAEALYVTGTARRLSHWRMVSDEVAREYDPRGHLYLSANVLEIWENAV